MTAASGSSTSRLNTPSVPRTWKCTWLFRASPKRCTNSTFTGRQRHEFDTPVILSAIERIILRKTSTPKRCRYSHFIPPLRKHYTRNSAPPLMSVARHLYSPHPPIQEWIQYAIHCTRKNQQTPRGLNPSRASRHRLYRRSCKTLTTFEPISKSLLDQIPLPTKLTDAPAHHIEMLYRATAWQLVLLYSRALSLPDLRVPPSPPLPKHPTAEVTEPFAFRRLRRLSYRHP